MLLECVKGSCVKKKKKKKKKNGSESLLSTAGNQRQALQQG